MYSAQRATLQSFLHEDRQSARDRVQDVIAEEQRQAPADERSPIHSALAEYRSGKTRREALERAHRERCHKPPGPKPQRTGADRIAHNRERNRRNQQARRERHREIDQLLDELTVPDVVDTKPTSPVFLSSDAAAFDAWIARGGRKQQQLLRMRDALLTTRGVLDAYRATHGRDPGYGCLAIHLATALGTPVTKDAARQRLKRVVELEAEGGPWFRAEGFTR